MGSACEIVDTWLVAADGPVLWARFSFRAGVTGPPNRGGIAVSEPRMRVVGRMGRLGRFLEVYTLLTWPTEWGNTPVVTVFPPAPVSRNDCCGEGRLGVFILSLPSPLLQRRLGWPRERPTPQAAGPRCLSAPPSEDPQSWRRRPLDHGRPQRLPEFEYNPEYNGHSWP